MTKSRKLLSLLVLGLMVTGCDVEALPSDYESEYGAIKMEELYDAIRNGQGEAAIYNEFIQTIAEKEIRDANRWNELVSRVSEKIEDMIEDQYTEYDYSKYGEENFEEVNTTKLTAYYKSQGYKIADSEDAWDVKKVLNDGVVNTYISKTLKGEVLTSMLNEQFIYTKKANSLYKTKQLRQIEYVYVDFDSENEEETLEFVHYVDKELQKDTSSLHDLKEIETEWKEKKKAVIDTNLNKVGDPELDEDGKYYNQFSSCSNSSFQECANEKKHEVDETEYYHEPEIYTKSDSPLLTSMSDAIFSSTIVKNDEYDKDKVFTITANNVTYHYLKSQSSIELGTESLINVDSTTGNYYFVRFTTVANIDPNSSDAEEKYSNITPKYEGQEAKYAIAQALATESSNYSNCIIYYLDKYELTIHDDKFFEYIFDTYGYPEEE